MSYDDSSLGRPESDRQSGDRTPGEPRGPALRTVPRAVVGALRSHVSAWPGLVVEQRAALYEDDSS
ncbi:hypothetical protein [Haloarchaeobius sp. HRN-SO-5]|uniref:hypothetical protein n=1 Tax=Haloarchaeobius sp. HRN-SO-5 TaxID=3446118 RepID=UPI003EBBEB46